MDGALPVQPAEIDLDFLNVVVQFLNNNNITKANFTAKDVEADILAKPKEVFPDSIEAGATTCKIPKREQSKAAKTPSASPKTAIAQFRLATPAELGASTNR